MDQKIKGYQKKHEHLHTPTFIHNLLVTTMFVSKPALSAVFSIEMASHKHPRTALLIRALSPQTIELAIGFNL